MQGEKKERWMEIAEQVANEQDPVKFDQLVTELNRLLREKDQRLHSPETPKTLGPMANLELTFREQQVLSQLVYSKSNKEIGTTLGLREGTVKVHMSHLLAKLRVNNRLQALTAATMRGLVFQPVGDDPRNTEAA
ncbi:MAG TPA: LuxR C-terminal-related transcriptional regulator [Terriglobales bacterium]|nr:LuxR C-terminal-related transcriptional regulator [Terriglobales bacterium]